MENSHVSIVSRRSQGECRRDQRRTGRTTAVWALALLGASTVLFATRPASAGVEAEIEASVVAASRNDTRIPGDGGTELSLVDDLSTSPAPAFRVRLGYRLADRHLISALYAPLRVNARGTVERDVEFLGATYPAGQPLLAVYRFDSYRVTYRYSILRDEGLDVGVGFTAKIRDAETSLYGAQARRKTNTGFVPLLNAHLDWRPDDGAFGLAIDVDALAAPQGRAADVLLAATWVFHPQLELRAGYRMVEGGADNDEVYSFAWLHYAVVGLKITPGADGKAQARDPGA